MNFDRLDSNSFRPFVAAARSLNFTNAARDVHMTQSGISQHIAKLEARLGTPLFRRVNKKVFLTEAGQLLLQFIQKQDDETNYLLEKIDKRVNQIAGEVRYAMPHSCLLSPHLGMLLQRRDQFPNIRLSVEACSNTEVVQKLLDQKIDFGFVTEAVQNPAIHLQTYCREEYILVGPVKFMLKAITAETLKELPFVSYPGLETFFNAWAGHHFPRSRSLTLPHLQVAASINSIHGAKTILSHQLGFSVMPRHCAADLIQRKTLREYSIEKREPFMNKIYIATCRDFILSRRVRVIINTFLKLLDAKN